MTFFIFQVNTFWKLRKMKLHSERKIGPEFSILIIMIMFRPLMTNFL